MNPIAWNKRKVSLAVALCAIIAVSSIIFLQNNQTTQAALINPHPNLMAWWSFNEDSGTAVGDSSGNGNNGNINGVATWVAGEYGSALSFDGASNYVQGLTSCLPQGPLTLSCWFNAASISGQQELIAERYDRFSLHLSGNTLVFQIYTGSLHSVSFGPINANAWYLAAAVYNSTGMYLFLNGAPVRSTLGAFGNILYIDSIPRVGAEVYSSPVNFFNGIIDEVRIYNRALSSSEIQADFQGGPDFSSNTIAKVPQGTTQVITTLSWQGTGSINVTIISPSQTYTESTTPMYQKTSYSTSDGLSTMLNVKRLSVSVNALPSDQNWNITLAYDNPVPYQITVEVQK